MMHQECVEALGDSFSSILVLLSIWDYLPFKFYFAEGPYTMKHPANVICEGVSLNLGFVFSRILGIVSSCLSYHKSSLVLLWFRIWGIFGPF
jgi:hypothetical protein